MAPICSIVSSIFIFFGVWRGHAQTGMPMPAGDLFGRMTDNPAGRDEENKSC